MGLKSKIATFGLLIVISGFTVFQIGHVIQEKQTLSKQYQSKVERENVCKEDYDKYQDYLNTFIGTNISEIESELIKESWSKDGNKFTGVNGDTITIKYDKYDTLTSIEFKANQLTKVIYK